MNTKKPGSKPKSDNMVADSISQRSYRALLWNYSGTVVSMLSQLVVGIVLARLLGPEAFGVVAIGVLMLGIGNLVADFGFSTALIQAKDITDDDIAFVFFAQVTLGTLLALIGYIGSGTIAIFFRQPDSAPIIAAMSSLFFLQSFGQSSSALLRRALNFKEFQGINIVSYLTGYVLVGIPCAVYGLGPWSLVAAQLTQSFMFSLMAVRRARLPMRLSLRPVSPGLFAFGGKIICINLSNWGISNLDSVAVGRWLGVIDLGVYNRSMVLIAAPINTMVSALQGVLFAACSRAESDVSKIKKGYFAASMVIGLVCLPLCLTAASVSETVITAIYGEKWLAAIPIFQPLALALAINALLSITGPILTAQNKLSIELRAEVVSLLLMLPVIYLAAQQSAVAIAWGVLAVSVLRWGLLLYALSLSLDTKYAELLKPFIWPLIYAVFVAGLTSMTDQLLQGVSPLLRLVGDIVTAMLCMVFLLRVFGKKVMRGPAGSYLMAQGRMPILFQRWMGVYNE